MKKAILGKKLGMTQIFTSDGRVVPVTVVEAGPCTVVQKKTVQRDGYSSVQVGFSAMEENRAKKLKNKPELGHFEKAGVAPTRYLRELRLDDAEQMEVGQVIKADVFGEGDKVDVTGISKGKGFTGAITRWHMTRGPMAHGSKYHRGQGSMGANSTPSRVFKNKKMAGHKGAQRVTVQHLEVVKVDADRNLLLIKGALPGANGSLVVIRDSVKARRS